MGFNLIATGSTKSIYEATGKGAPQNIVFATAKHPWQTHKLRNELLHCEQIRSVLQAKNLPTQHLALDCSESSTRPHNTFTLEMPKASCDLEEAILDKTRSMSQRLQFCKDVSSAVATFHDAGFVHQDLKTNNFLVFSNWRSSVTKLSDFDTTTSMDAEDVSLQLKGNIRYASPENVLSQKGEVFSLALILIRILEEAILPSFPSSSTLVPAPKRALPLLQYKPARGVIQYLIAHPFSDRSSFSFLATFATRVISYLKYKLTGNELFLLSSYDKQHAIHTYIDALQSKLGAQRSLPASSSVKICELLKKMTLADPLQRPSSREVQRFFRSEALSYTDKLLSLWERGKEAYRTGFQAS